MRHLLHRAVDRHLVDVTKPPSNAKGDGVKATIDGGTLGPSRNGAKRKILGTFSFTTTAAALSPMFITEDSSVFGFLSEVSSTGPFEVLLRETRKGQTKAVAGSLGRAMPCISNP